MALDCHFWSTLPLVRDFASSSDCLAVFSSNQAGAPQLGQRFSVSSKMCPQFLHRILTITSRSIISFSLSIPGASPSTSFQLSGVKSDLGCTARTYFVEHTEQTTLGIATSSMRPPSLGHRDLLRARSKFLRCLRDRQEPTPSISCHCLAAL